MSLGKAPRCSYLGNHLAKFVDVPRIARPCNQIIMTNFAGTLLVDTAEIVLAMRDKLSVGNV
jgi:hypothetical protein